MAAVPNRHNDFATSVDSPRSRMLSCRLKRSNLAFATPDATLFKEEK